MVHRYKFVAAVSIGLALIGAFAGPAVQRRGSETINIHTTRDRALIEPMLRVFEGLARFKLNVTHLTSPPQAQLKADAAAGKVDLFIAREFSQLVAAKVDGITQAAGKAEFAKRIPEHYRDKEGHWFGLTAPPRALATSRDRVKQTTFTYEDLADQKWKGKICIGPGLHPYNVGLVASMIAHRGASFAEVWLNGVKANLAMKPAGNDPGQLMNVHAGKCDIALVNANYVGALRASRDKSEQQAAGYGVNIVFPNSADRGAHVSLSGMSLIKNAPGSNNALLLMDFLTSEPSQFIYAEENHEYPTRAGVKPSNVVASWGTPKLDALPLDKIAYLQGQATELIKKVGFDNGPGI